MAGYPGQYGTVLVKKETLDNSLNTIIGAPVIINHTDVTEDNADDLRVGVISNAYYNDKDGWYWCEGVIWDETAQNLITEQKWSVSCSYNFLEQDDEGGTENNIPYDKEFTKLNFVHLALVNNPRYERANIVFNNKTVDNDILTVESFKKILLQAVKEVAAEKRINNGWVTLNKTNEDGERIRIFIDGYEGSSNEVKWFEKDIKEYKETHKMKVDLKGISEKTSSTLLDTVNNILAEYNIKDLVSLSKGNLTKAYAFNITNHKENAIKISNKLFSDVETLQKKFERDCDNLFHPKGLKNIDPVKSIIMHELGHSITVAGGNNEFWSEIDTVIKNHNKELGASTYKKFIKDKQNLNLRNFLSSYALYNPYEFVAEAFADAKLSETPCKYSLDVLECIDKHFKKTGVSNSMNKDKEKSNDDLFLENYGLGYPSQDEFEKWLEEQDENIDK